MTGLTKPCPGCDGDGRVGMIVRGEAGLEWCPECDGSGLAHVMESELEAHVQLNALTED
jgi:DnaJ-class molecular chaperone